MRNTGWTSLPADRSFKVLQPSRTPAQLSLFPPPGLVPRTGRWIFLARFLDACDVQGKRAHRGG
jgi:hypothetical protein